MNDSCRGCKFRSQAQHNVHKSWCSLEGENKKLVFTKGGCSKKVSKLDEIEAEYLVRKAREAMLRKINGYD